MISSEVYRKSLSLLPDELSRALRPRWAPPSKPRMSFPAPTDDSRASQPKADPEKKKGSTDH
jgi:hypothetical protein